MVEMVVYGHFDSQKYFCNFRWLKGRHFGVSQNPSQYHQEKDEAIRKLWEFFETVSESTAKVLTKNTRQEQAIEHRQR